MSELSPLAWLEPRLVSLFAEAARAGIARDVVVAVVTDLVNGRLSAGELASGGDNPDQDIGEPSSMVFHGSDAAQIVPDAGDPMHNPLDQVGRHSLQR